MHTTKAFPRLALAVPLAVALAAAVGCAGGDPAVIAETTFDTSGDTIIARIGSGVDAEPHTLAVERSIGDSSGVDEYTFGNITDVAIGPNDEVYIWDRQAKLLRLYDSSGTFIRQIGRTGAGPGEYDHLNGVAVRGDGRLVAWDPAHSRVNVYSAQGNHETQWQAPGGYFASRSIFADTANTLYLRTSVGRDTTQVLGIMGFLRISPDGAMYDSIRPPDFGTVQPQLMAQGNGGRSARTIPFYPRTSWAMSPHGYLVAGPGSPYVIHVLRTDGKPVRIVRDVTPPAVDPEEREEYRAQALYGLRLTDPNYQWDGPEIPDTKPAYTSITVDLDGRIWVRVSQPSERIPEAERTPQQASPLPGPTQPSITWREATAYDVYSPDGHFLGHVPMPRRTVLFQARGDHLWASTLDSMDIPAVTRFRIEPALAASTDR